MFSSHTSRTGQTFVSVLFKLVNWRFIAIGSDCCDDESDSGETIGGSVELDVDEYCDFTYISGNNLMALLLLIELQLILLNILQKPFKISLEFAIILDSNNYF